MARNDELAREKDDDGKSLLDRRSYLRLAGSAAASVFAFGANATAASGSDLLLYEDFENGDYTDCFNDAQPTADQQDLHGLVTSPVKAGNRSLQIQFPEGRQDGMRGRFDPKELSGVDSRPRDLYTSYWVYFPDNFVSVSGQSKKLPGPVNYFQSWSETDGNGDGHGGDPSKGYGWSARTSFKDSTSSEIELGAYVYHMDMGGQYGDNWGTTWITKGEWHRIDQHVSLNSVSGGSANADGVLEMWIDGTKQVDRHDLRWTNYPAEGSKFEFTTWYGGSNESPKDQALYLGNVGLSTKGVPDFSSSEPTNGKVLELVSGSNSPTTQYQFVVEGDVQKRTTAGDVSAEGNDSITVNDDGTVTVTGKTGNGYGDSYVVDGTIRSMSGIDESTWTIRYDGQEATIEEIVEPSGLVVDKFDVSKSQQLGDDQMFSVTWAVSDAQQDLDTVEVSVVEDTQDMNFSVTNVNGASASGWDLFQFPTGSSLTVNVRVKDVAGNVTKKSQSITL